MNISRIKVVVVDDHQIFKDGMISLFSNDKNIEITGEASNLRELISVIDKSACEVVLLDLNLGDEDGIEVLKELKKRFPDVKVIVITMYNESNLIQHAFNFQADGYLLKSAGRDELVRAIIDVINGRKYRADGLALHADTPLKRLHVEQKYSDDFLKKNNLTRRETDILVLMAQSYSTKEIADVLFISELTVQTHRKNIKAKLGLKNTASVIKFAFDNQLL